MKYYWCENHFDFFSKRIIERCGGHCNESPYVMLYTNGQLYQVSTSPKNLTSKGHYHYLDKESFREMLYLLI